VATTTNNKTTTTTNKVPLFISGDTIRFKIPVYNEGRRMSKKMVCWKSVSLGTNQASGCGDVVYDTGDGQGGDEDPSKLKGIERVYRLTRNTLAIQMEMLIEWEFLSLRYTGCSVRKC